MEPQSGTAVFVPKARVIRLLGEELISNEVIAVMELVKNGYDACSKEVTVELIDINNRENGVMIIKDYGSGMTLDTLLNAWLQPGTNIKKRERDEKKRNRNCNRPVLGEKGVGRFAAQKLGSMIFVASKTSSDVFENCIEVNWNLFDDNSLLKDVKVNYWQSKLKYFKNTETGTYIEITFLKKEWTSGMVRLLNQKLNVLNSPFPSKDIFDVELKSNIFQEELKKAPDFNEIVEKAVYSFEGNCDANGFLDAKYDFFYKMYPQFERRRDYLESIIENDPNHFREGRKPLCGPFKISFYAWDLDITSLTETINRSYYLNTIKPFTGVKIYRDGFRVLPYGEENDDWLSLDGRRVNEPVKKLSRNQFIGILEITLNDNPKLIDKTDREGIIDSVELEDFKHLIMIIVSLFENERRNDKDKIDALREKKRPGDEVILAIEDLKKKIIKMKHYEIYEKDIKEIENKYDNKIKDITNYLLVSAGVGLSYMLPAHDISDNVTKLKQRIEDILEKNRLSEKEYKNEIYTYLTIVNLLDDLSRGIRNIGRKSSFEKINLSSIVKETMLMAKYRLAKEGIDLSEMDVIEDTKIKCKKNLVIVALMNLIDNSSYWIKGKPKNEWKIKITIDKDEYDNPRIIVSDRGPGIKDSLDAIVQPFYTRKPDGTGLGLTIVKEIMDLHDGHINLLFEGEEPFLWPGANVALVFRKELIK